MLFIPANLCVFPKNKDVLIRDHSTVIASGI